VGVTSIEESLFTPSGPPDRLSGVQVDSVPEMKFLAAPVLLLGTAVVCAGAQSDKVIIAAMKLSEVPSYGWTTTVNDELTTYHVHGKTDASGWTWLRLPMIRSIAQRLGRDADVEVEAYFKRSDAFVIRTEDGWKTLDELPRRHREWVDDRDPWTLPQSSIPRIGALGLGSGGRQNDPFKLDPFPVIQHRSRGRAPRNYGHAQFGLSRPHDELGVIVSSHTELFVEGDVVTGVLSDLGAQLLLVREGQDHIQPLAAAGVFKLQLQRGMVTKYLLRLEGDLMVDGKRVLLRQTSSTEINQLGTASLQLPEEAVRKLGGT
jgi:hypothetical protein